MTYCQTPSSRPFPHVVENVFDRKDIEIHSIWILSSNFEVNVQIVLKL